MAIAKRSDVWVKREIDEGNHVTRLTNWEELNEECNRKGKKRKLVGKPKQPLALMHDYGGSCMGIITDGGCDVGGWQEIGSRYHQPSQGCCSRQY